MRTRLPVLLALVWALPGAARSAAVEVDGRVSVGPAWDSNATRAVAGAGTAADEALRVVGDLEARLAPPGRFAAVAGYHGGVDDFRAHGDGDRTAHRLSLAGSVRASRLLAPGLEGQARFVRAGDGRRDATDRSAAATLEVGPVARAAATLRLGLRRFAYADPAFSFRGPFAGAAARWEPARGHVLALGYEVSARAFPDGTAHRRPAPPDEGFLSRDRLPRSAPPAGTAPLIDEPPPMDPPTEKETPSVPPDTGPSALGRRHDLAHAATASWTWKGPAILGGGYTFARVDSNGYGLDTDRHRFHVLGAVRLPGEVRATAEAALQVVRFPDGIFLSEELLLVDDEENLSSLSLQLSRPLGEGLSVELRHASYLGSFREAGFRYERHVSGAAMTYRF